MAQKAGLSEVVVMGDKFRVAPLTLQESIQVRLLRMYPGSRYLAQPRAVLTPLPADLTDEQLIEWARSFLVAIAGAEATVTTPEGPTS